MHEELSEYEKQQKKAFDNASHEDQLRIANSANDQLIQITSAKLATLPTISGVAAALLIIASFHTDLYSSSFVTKVIVSFLLMVVSISLLFYVEFMSKIEEDGVRLLTKVYEVPLRADATTFHNITYSLPRYVSWSLLIITGLVTYGLWSSC